VNKEELKTLEKISKDFEKIAKLTNNGSEEYVEKVTIMGGEPLLYPYVSEAITLIRSYFQNVDMYFLTNGTLLHKMDEDFWQSIIKNNITIAVSIYPINFDYS